jgi:nitrogen-specific signal transduction histidine kinase
MRTALVVSADEALRARVSRALENQSVFTAASDAEAFRTLRVTEVDLIVKDAAPIVRDVASFIERARQLRPASVVLCVLPADTASLDAEEAVDAADFVLLQPFTSRHLQSLLRQAAEKLGLLHEVVALRSSATASQPAESAREPAEGPEIPPHALAQVVRELAKALAVGFDLPRLLDLCLDAVSELGRPSRSAILLAEGEGRPYRVRAHRNLPPHIARSVVLSAEVGLPLWLATEGRIMRVEEAQRRASEPATREIAREMAVLQATVAIPLLAHGELVGILALGRRITGEAYGQRETEVLFDLATHVATAIRDTRMHHLLQYQKEFTDRILAHMSNGVITIGPEERVILMNRRAEEILDLPAARVLNQDLRMLPSPLGDLLFETLTRGRTLTRSEIQLALRNLPLEVSTYPVRGDEATPLGAVLVFEDLTAQRRLAAEKRAAEQFQLLTRIVARIADEIKNPLVSIRTFIELLDERYDDAGFRTQFASVVGRDVRRLVEVFERLAALVGEGGYRVDPVDLRLTAEECLADLGAQARPAEGSEASRLLVFTDASTEKQVTATFSHEGGPFHARADRAMLKKALAYLIWYLLGKTPRQEARLAVAVSSREGEGQVRVTVASRSAEVSAAELERLFDPIRVVQENLIDVGPCVSQRIVEGQGGRLEARQSRNEVRFTLTLPAATEPSP